jgi:hypothetical protein
MKYYLPKYLNNSKNQQNSIKETTLSPRNQKISLILITPVTFLAFWHKLDNLLSIKLALIELKLGNYQSLTWNRAKEDERKKQEGVNRA